MENKINIKARERERERGSNDITYYAERKFSRADVQLTSELAYN